MMYTPTPLAPVLDVSPDEALLRRARAYLLKWQPRLNLLGYEIELRVEPPVEQVDVRLAECSPQNRSRLAVIRVAPDHDERAVKANNGQFTADQELENTVIHELCHLLTNDELANLHFEAERLVGRDHNTPLVAALWASIHDLEETAICRMTRLLIQAERGRWCP